MKIWTVISWESCIHRKILMGRIKEHANHVRNNFYEKLNSNILLVFNVMINCRKCIVVTEVVLVIFIKVSLINWDTLTLKVTLSACLVAYSLWVYLLHVNSRKHEYKRGCPWTCGGWTYLKRIRTAEVINKLFMFCKFRYQNWFLERLQFTIFPRF